MLAQLAQSAFYLPLCRRAHSLHLIIESETERLPQVQYVVTVNVF